MDSNLAHHVDNLYVLLKGKKRFTLFSPADVDKMYLVGELDQVFPNGLISFKGMNQTNEEKEEKEREKQEEEEGDKWGDRLSPLSFLLFPTFFFSSFLFHYLSC